MVVRGRDVSAAPAARDFQFGWRGRLRNRQSVRPCGRRDLRGRSPPEAPSPVRCRTPPLRSALCVPRRQRFSRRGLEVAAEQITITKAQGFELLEALDVAVEIAIANGDLPNRVRFEDARAVLLDAIFPDLPDAE